MCRLEYPCAGMLPVLYDHVIGSVMAHLHCRRQTRIQIPNIMATLYCAQGGHGTGKTGKTGNLVLTFSRQGKHREFCFDTGKNFETQGKYFSVTQGKNLDTGEIFDCDY